MKIDQLDALMRSRLAESIATYRKLLEEHGATPDEIEQALAYHRAELEQAWAALRRQVLEGFPLELPSSGSHSATNAA